MDRDGRAGRVDGRLVVRRAERDRPGDEIDRAGAAGHRAGGVDAARHRHGGAAQEEAAAGSRRAGLPAVRLMPLPMLTWPARLDRAARGRPCSRCRSPAARSRCAGSAPPAR